MLRGFRTAAAAACAAAACVAVAVLVPGGTAGAASGHRVTVLQLNASEGTSACPNPAATDCLAVLGGSNGNRDMYAVEEVCKSDALRFAKANPSWAVVYRTQTARRHASPTTCKDKGEMLASPHRITGVKVYRLSKGFTASNIRHNYLLVCGLIHASRTFHGCATHLVFPRPDRSAIQVRNLVRDTAAYRSGGRVVVAGDFNIAESGAGAGATPRLKPIVGAGFQETDKNKTATHGSRKFDYIFYFGPGGVRQRAALTGEVATSDHRVLLGEARI